MKNNITLVKKKLDAAISQLCEVSWMFSKKPGIYFSRDRKLPFPKIVSSILSMEGGCLTTELLKHFGCSADIASSSAFVQQRSKLSEETFPLLFSLFVKKSDSPKRYKGFWLSLMPLFRLMSVRVSPGNSLRHFREPDNIIGTVTTKNMASPK